MAKKVKKQKPSGLGRGLDSLIPNYYDDENEENKNSLTLEDILEEKEELKKEKERENINEKSIEEKSELEDLNIENVKEIEEDLNKTKGSFSEPELESIKDEILEINDEFTNEEDRKEIENISGLNKDGDNISVIKEEVIEELKIDELDTKTDSEEDSTTKDKEILTIKDSENSLDFEIDSLNTELSEFELESIAEVKEMIEKNPRITLWSAKSAAVFRYLRKTQPEFSISKKASELVDEAVQKKYPEIWELFGDI